MSSANRPKPVPGAIPSRMKKPRKGGSERNRDSQPEESEDAPLLE